MTDRALREMASRPVVNDKTVFVVIPANAVPTVAEDMATILEDLGVAAGRMVGLLLVNDSGASVWLRGTAAGAGTGIELPNGANLYLGWSSVPTGVVFAEAAAAFDAMVVTT